MAVSPPSACLLLMFSWGSSACSDQAWLLVPGAGDITGKCTPLPWLRLWEQQEDSRRKWTEWYSALGGLRVETDALWDGRCGGEGQKAGMVGRVWWDLSGPRRPRMGKEKVDKGSVDGVSRTWICCLPSPQDMSDDCFSPSCTETPLDRDWKTGCPSGGNCVF